MEGLPLFFLSGQHVCIGGSLRTSWTLLILDIVFPSCVLVRLALASLICAGAFDGDVLKVDAVGIQVVYFYFDSPWRAFGSICQILDMDS